MAATSRKIAIACSLSAGVVSKARRAAVAIAREAHQRIGEPAREMGCAAPKRLLSIPDPPKASRYVNDETAWAVLWAIKGVAGTCGEDIARNGTDCGHAAHCSNPVCNPFEVDSACLCSHLRAAQLSGQPIPTRRVVREPALLIRVSTGPPS